MVYEITRGGTPKASDEKGPIGVSAGYQRNLSIAEGLERASKDSLTKEFADISSAETIGALIASEDIVLDEFQVRQEASDDGSSVSNVDLLVNDSSVLDSAVALDDSGAATQSGTIDTPDVSDGDRVEVDVDGTSDDASPPRVYCTVTYRLVKDRYTDRTA